MLKSGTCGCLDFDLKSGDDYETILPTMVFMESFIGDYDEDTQRAVIDTLCNDLSNDGDHLQVKGVGRRVRIIISIGEISSSLNTTYQYHTKLFFVKPLSGLFSSWIMSPRPAGYVMWLRLGLKRKQTCLLYPIRRDAFSLPLPLRRALRWTRRSGPLTPRWSAFTCSSGSRAR